MKVNILPADTYIVINRTILNEMDRKIITSLYQPIIGSTASNLYFTLWAYLDKFEVSSMEWTHHHLMTSMRLKLSDIIEARQLLEGIGLVKTYYKKNNISNFVYELYSPLSVSEFLKNPILSTSLYNNVGDSEFKSLISYFKLPSYKLNDYEDITLKFDEVFEAVPISNLDHLLSDIKKRRSNNLNIINKIDLDEVFNLIPNDLLNRNGITKSIKELLYRLSFVYDIDTVCMRELIVNNLNEKKLIDPDRIRKSAEKIYLFQNNSKLPSLVFKNQPNYLRKPLGDSSPRALAIYQFETTSPYHFLLAKSKGDSLTKTERDILATLALDLTLNPGVINVLLDFVLKINNNKLNKSFIEQIGSQWKRNKIETVEEAMTLAEKEYSKKKTYNQNTKSKSIVPSWIDKEFSKSEVSECEANEIDNILEEFKK